MNFAIFFISFFSHTEGFIATTTEPQMIGQMQVLELANVHFAKLQILGMEMMEERESISFFFSSSP
jgi:hypothetical protein